MMNKVYIKNFLLLYITLWHNGIVERKNKAIQEMTRTILNSKKVTLYFWGETVNIIVHILNRVGVRPGNKTHSLWVMEQQEVHVQIKCLGVLDISWEIKKTCISLTTYKVYNLQTQTVMESINMVVDDNLKEFVKKNLDNIIEITE
jgi:hypothetical protein